MRTTHIPRDRQHLEITESIIDHLLLLFNAAACISNGTEVRIVVAGVDKCGELE